MTLDEMAYQFFDTGWFDPNDRPKTALAMQHLIERVPDDVFNTLARVSELGWKTRQV